MNISKLLKKYEFTNSPYIFYDDNMPSMYFTVYQNGIWNLYFTDNKEVRKVDFLQDISIENITCFKKQDLYCVSFCGRMGENVSLYYAETLNPFQFKIITSVFSNCRSGLVNSKYIIIINKDNNILIYNTTQLDLNNLHLSQCEPIYKLFFDFPNPINISFVTGDEDQLIISYQDQQYSDRRGSIYVNLNNINDQKQILIENEQPIINATIDPFTHQVLYETRIGLKNFHRKIAKTFIKNITSNQVLMLK